MLALALAPFLEPNLTRFSCDQMSYVVLQGAVVGKTTVSVERKAEQYFVWLDTENSPQLTAKRQRVNILLDGGGVRHLWPASLKNEAGEIIEVELTSTGSTMAGTDTALLISQGGDYSVGGIVENDHNYIAVGMCSATKAENQ